MLVGELVGFAFVVQVLMTLFAGPLIDRRGARLAIRLGPAFYVVAAVLFTTTTPLMLAVARAMQGIGAAMIIPAAFSLLPSLVITGLGTGVGAALLLPPILLELTKRSDQGDRGTAMALYSTSFSAAVGVGSLAGAPLVARAGFGSALVVSTVPAWPRRRSS